MSNRKQVLLDLNEVKEELLDSVPSGAYNQVRWERDMALEQLESYGVSFGEQAEVVRVVHGKWTNIMELGNGTCMGFCSVCGTGQHSQNITTLKGFRKYCHWCGAKMDLE
jgi:hypothetical protein